ncbi:MAG: histidine triad nucleotide-binding protein [Patescibacteria group bacterium]|nr:histidine triad nucleotide-binding protein [Patescibacteria group bacterium]MCL5093624.1 histidine triad nucleotide-binding protein [Patescibacteria group bacterium]
MNDCIFCKIVNKDIPSKIVYEDDSIIAFDDINPEAPVHVLIVTKKHLTGINGVEKGDKEVLGQMFLVAKKVAEIKGVKDSGYRFIINSGRNGHQLIKHLHMHLLGGRDLGPKLVA